VSDGADSAVGADSLAAPGVAPLPANKQFKCQESHPNEKHRFFLGYPAEGRVACKKV
jgi:hypothetical protein